jgi:hypothetical protein
MKKSYYAVIPANVRYNKKLTANAKLLYGEITALCNEKGYCWASNSYFAKLYSVSNKSISLWIKQLSNHGFLKSEIIYKEGTKEIVNRYIRICGGGMEENVNTPMEEKVKDNITSSNNTINNTSNNIYTKNKNSISKKEREEQFEKLWKKYPKKQGKPRAYAYYMKKIKDNAIYELINKAIDNYNADIEANKTEGKYIKNGDGFFCGEYWEYWSNYDVSKNKPKDSDLQTYKQEDDIQWIS